MYSSALLAVTLFVASALAVETTQTKTKSDEITYYGPKSINPVPTKIFTKTERDEKKYTTTITTYSTVVIRPSKNITNTVCAVSIKRETLRRSTATCTQTSLVKTTKISTITDTITKTDTKTVTKTATTKVTKPTQRGFRPAKDTIDNHYYEYSGTENSGTEDYVTGEEDYSRVAEGKPGGRGNGWGGPRGKSWGQPEGKSSGWEENKKSWGEPAAWSPWEKPWDQDWIKPWVKPDRSDKYPQWVEKVVIIEIRIVVIAYKNGGVIASTAPTSYNTVFSTSTVTLTQTEPRASCGRFSTKTTTCTETLTSKKSTTTTKTETKTVTYTSSKTTSYAACATDNVIDKARGKPIYNVKNIKRDETPNGMYVKARNAEECCVVCQKSAICQGSSFTKNECFIYYDKKGMCKIDKLALLYDTTKQVFDPLFISNGVCGFLSLDKKHLYGESNDSGWEDKE